MGVARVLGVSLDARGAASAGTLPELKPENCCLVPSSHLLALPGPRAEATPEGGRRRFPPAPARSHRGTYLVKRESSPARTVTSGGGKHSFTARGQGEAEGWEKRGLPSPAPGGALGGAVPREKRRLRVGDQLTLQLPVWGSQGHWCSHLQGLWQPGPYQPRGHSAGRSQDSGGGLGGQASLCAARMRPGVGRARLTQKQPRVGLPPG